MALTAFLVFALQRTPLMEAVHTAGMRWAIEVRLEATKQGSRPRIDTVLP